MVLRGVPMDDVRRGSGHGCHHPCWRHVPIVATHHASRGVVPQRGAARPHRRLLCTGDCEADSLRDHRRRRATRYMDLPETLCGRGRGEHPINVSRDMSRVDGHDGATGRIVHSILGVGYAEEEGR